MDITAHVSISPDRQPLVASTLKVIVKHGMYRDPESGKEIEVVVKSTKPMNDSEEAAVTNRLRRESEILSKLQHPNILSFFGTYMGPDVETRPALVFLYCPKGNVLEYVEKNLDVDRLNLVVSLAKGLEYLHEHDVMHGYLMPEHILVTDDGKPVLSNFGRSKIRGYQGLTTQSPSAAQYSAPEAWMVKSNSSLSKESDVYSFGITALHILSGRPPFFKSSSTMPVRRSLSYEDYGSMSLAHWQIIEPCWNYDPKARPFMSEVIGALEAAQ